MPLKQQAVHGSITTHGATLIASTQQIMTINGLFALVAGDGGYCPKCLVWSQIMPRGNDFYTIMGHEVAYFGSKLTCGAEINFIPQSIAVMDDAAGGGDGSKKTLKTKVVNKPNSAHTFDQHVRLVDQKTGNPLANVKYELVGDSGKVSGVTDQDGLTEKITDSVGSNAKVHFFHENN